MKVLYLDCGMGAAGDMLQAALVSLFSKEEQESFITKINNIGIDGVKVTLQDEVKCGITGKHVRVHINGEEEHSCDVYEHHHHDEHSHDEHHHHGEHTHEEQQHHHDEHSHDGHHHHSSMHDIEYIISNLDVSEKVKDDALSVYRIVANAEAKVHGKNVTEVHFHEVGMKDAIVDIVSVAMLMEMISADKIVVSPINVGFGKVKCAHGILPVPAPATAEIISGIPTYAGRFEGEMCTPTGAALLKYYADEFSHQPLLKIEKTGYGAGTKDFAAANVVKAVIGEFSEINTISERDESYSDRIVELRCNVDDMTGEEMSYVIEVLFENGVRDAFVTPVIMKKGRSGMLLTVLCNANDKEKIASLVFKHTSTIGIREYSIDRMILKRREEIVHTKYGDVKTKVSTGFGIEKVKAEFEDLKELATRNGLSINEIRKIVEKAILEKE